MALSWWTAIKKLDPFSRLGIIRDTFFDSLTIVVLIILVRGTEMVVGLEQTGHWPDWGSFSARSLAELFSGATVRADYFALTVAVFDALAKLSIVIFGLKATLRMLHTFLNDSLRPG